MKQIRTFVAYFVLLLLISTLNIVQSTTKAQTVDSSLSKCGPPENLIVLPTIQEASIPCDTLVLTKIQLWQYAIAVLGSIITTVTITWINNKFAYKKE